MQSRIRWNIAAGIILGGLAVATSAAGRTDAYQIIAERNAFGLRPRVAAEPVPNRVSRAAPHVRLTGLTDILGRRQALLEIAEKGRPTIRPVLGEGEACGAVEVCQVDIARALVTLRVDGVAATLTFEPAGADRAPADAKRRPSVPR
jgi:hypothetical protein